LWIFATEASFVENSSGPLYDDVGFPIILSVIVLSSFLRVGDTLRIKKLSELSMNLLEEGTAFGPLSMNLPVESSVSSIFDRRSGEFSAFFDHLG
jgi:hypothetical protein